MIFLSRNKLIAFLVVLMVSGTAVTAFAHGTMFYPPSRTWICFMEGPQSPKSGGCQAAKAVGGTQQFYEWDMINQLPDGDHKSFVFDGELCAGGREKYESLNQGLESWAKTPLIPDENGMSQFAFEASVPHLTNYFDFYVTKDDWDPMESITWDTLEPDPFCTAGEEPLVNGKYVMDCTLPDDKEGYHVVYMIWQRSDSPEAFYGCSDVLLGEAALIPTPTTPPPPQPGECRSATWVDIVVYDNGDLVTYNGAEYVAQWWTSDTPPNQSGDGQHPWTFVAECADISGPAEPIVTPIPTDVITDSMTAVPTEVATESPTESPTDLPTEMPTDVATEAPVDTATPTATATATVEPTPTEELIPLGITTSSADVPASNPVLPLLAGLIFALVIGVCVVKFNQRRA